MSYWPLNCRAPEVCASHATCKRRVCPYGDMLIDISNEVTAYWVKRNEENGTSLAHELRERAAMWGMA